MSLAQVLSTYLTLNLLVAVAFLALKFTSEVGVRFGKVFSGRVGLCRSFHDCCTHLSSPISSKELNIPASG